MKKIVILTVALIVAALVLTPAIILAQESKCPGIPWVSGTGKYDGIPWVSGTGKYDGIPWVSGVCK